MVKSTSRGHEIYYDNKIWRYLDTNEVYDDSRPCKRCGCFPTKEGYDACLGYLENVEHACCGHGIKEKLIIYKGDIGNVN